MIHNITPIISKIIALKVDKMFVVQVSVYVCVSVCAHARVWKGRGSSVANLATLSLDLATFQTPSDKSSDFWKNLSNFPNVASTVLRARDLELHLSLCLL